MMDYTIAAERLELRLLRRGDARELFDDCRLRRTQGIKLCVLVVGKDIQRGTEFPIRPFLSNRPRMIPSGKSGKP
jgi:hypothetical protein